MAILHSLSFFAAIVGLASGHATRRAHPHYARNATSARVGSDTTLSPIINPDTDTTNLGNLVPSASVSLNWGMEGNSLVNVSLEMNHPTVLLEEVDDIASVDCEATSVTIAFSHKDAFKKALSHWSHDGSFVLVTNHLGDCDAENERGIFLTSGITSNNKTLTIVASAEKSDLNNTAAYTEITFSSVPAGQAKRAISLDSHSLKLSNSLALPPSTSLYSYPPYLNVIADTANVSSSITFSGKLRYSILKAKVYELSFDVDTYASAELGLTLDVTAPYSQNFVYDPAPLTYNVVNVPGIVTLGPALDFDIGVNMSANAATVLTTDMGVKIADGNFHLDFLDSSSTSATGWTPVFTAQANISEKAAASVNPYVDITVMLQFELLGGLIDLSGGVTAKPRFNNDFVLTASQVLKGTAHGTSVGGSVAQPTGEVCAQGLSIASEFEFSVIAFVTQWWRETVYSVAVPVANKCYTWL